MTLCLMRNLEERDYGPILDVMDAWWGRSVSHLLPRVFFQHFQDTSFVVEQDAQIISFLVGFVSQTYPEQAYIHFVGAIAP
ncbi:hypothetical protein GCM10025857_37780 [Alicyclobacillus contaminans]|uniref:hypothetical protein n=1 Tax=Alicyclobacillus contaminans TaxID=392016 RepID=UPI0004269B10|nr:hypothetical protein [Alicyclobacillus contaminans]GMA52421.1 hypothetical protein GCM10025857_37780 [Alicyclobacillus contaminans]